MHSVTSQVGENINVPLKFSTIQEKSVPKFALRKYPRLRSSDLKGGKGGLEERRSGEARPRSIYLSFSKNINLILLRDPDQLVSPV